MSKVNGMATKIGDGPLALELIRYEPTGNLPGLDPRWFLSVARHVGGTQLISVEVTPSMLGEIEAWCRKARSTVVDDGGRHPEPAAHGREGEA